MLHRAKAYPAKRRFLATLGLSLVTSAGFVLSFTVLDAPDDLWRAMVVGITALMVPHVPLCWLAIASPQLRSILPHQSVGRTHRRRGHTRFRGV